MAAYIVATVQIEDRERFAAYAAGIAGLSEKFGGERVVAGVAHELLEGSAPENERIVVSRFPDADAARAYIASAEYQSAKAHREGAATVVMRLLVD
jgi:uncharacterized protein (DUF1330 family)